MEELIKKLASSGELLGSAYNDLISPGAKQAGQALETVLEFANSILLPIRLINHATRTLYERRIAEYNERLNKLSKSEIVKVHPDIGLQILERFTTVTDDELASLFTKLLESASTTANVDIAHPSFVSLISMLTPDEAIILKYIKQYGKYRISSITVTVKFERFPRDYVLRNATGLEQEIKINNLKRFGLYLDNLVALGLITQNTAEISDRSDQFAALSEKYEQVIGERIEFLGKRYGYDKAYDIGKEFKIFEVTEYGKVFLEACIPYSV